MNNEVMVIMVMIKKMTVKMIQKHDNDNVDNENDDKEANQYDGFGFQCVDHIGN